MPPDFKFDIILTNSGPTDASLDLFSAISGTSEKSNKYAVIAPFQALYTAGTTFLVSFANGSYDFFAQVAITPTDLITQLNALGGTWQLAFSDVLNGNVFYCWTPGQLQSVEIISTNEWISIPAGVGSLTGCQLVGQTGWAVGYNFPSAIILKTSNYGLSWVSQTSPIAAILEDVSIIDENNAFICGHSGLPAPIVLHTSNGGTNWTQQTLPVASGSLTAISFVDANTGWAVGQTGAPFDPLILNTTDGGANWVQQTSPVVSGNLFGLFFFDANNGWACGYSGANILILATTDGGANWVDQSPFLTGWCNSIFALDPLTAIAIGQDGSNNVIILKSTNGGTSWLPISSPVAIGELISIRASGSEIYAVGYSGASCLMLISTDNGDIWSEISLSTSGKLYDFAAAVNSKITVGNDGSGNQLVLQSQSLFAGVLISTGTISGSDVTVSEANGSGTLNGLLQSVGKETLIVDSFEIFSVDTDQTLEPIVILDKDAAGNVSQTVLVPEKSTYALNNQLVIPGNKYKLTENSNIKYSVKAGSKVKLSLNVNQDSRAKLTDLLDQPIKAKPIELERQGHLNADGKVHSPEKANDHHSVIVAACLVVVAAVSWIFGDGQCIYKKIRL